MNKVLILQARLDSTRLPRKALLPLDKANTPMIVCVMRALRTIDVDKWVLASPEDSEGHLRPLAESTGFEFFIGDKDNVLARYCAAAEKYSADIVVRATGDNPFVFADAAAALLDDAVNLDADYAGYSSIAYGSGIEIVKRSALEKALKYAEGAEKEHVCPYIYGRGAAGFLVHRPLSPQKWRFPDLRLTVDTKADYESAVSLSKKLDAIFGHSDARYFGENIIQAARTLTFD